MNELLSCAPDSATEKSSSGRTGGLITGVHLTGSHPPGSHPAGNQLVGSLTSTETVFFPARAAHHDGDAEVQYDDDEMDQLLEEIEFRISCLAELSPSIQHCMEHDEARLIPLPAIAKLSYERLQQHNKTPETPETLRILEERYPVAPKELLDRIYKAKTRRDANQPRTDFGLCTFDKCPAKYRIFEGAQWAHHEFSQHRFNRSWTCHICQRVEVDDSAWLKHLSAAHSIDLKGAQMPLASRTACQVHSRPVEQEKCHFCGQYPASTREGFEKHVGAHFQDACECIDNHTSSSLERMQPGSQTEQTANRYDKRLLRSPYWNLIG